MEQIKATVAQGLQRFHTIDVLCNNADYAHLGIFEEIDNNDLKECFQVNVTYTVNTIKTVLQLMRDQKYGHIFNTSSIAGFTSINFVSNYNIAKLSLFKLTEALCAELAPFYITTSVIVPGGFRTNFLDAAQSLKWSENVIPNYNVTFNQYHAMLQAADHQLRY